MPPEFEQWCKTSWLPANLGRDYYRCQAETHIQDLANKISRLQKEIEDRAGNLLDERDRMIQQRLWLQNELDKIGAGSWQASWTTSVMMVLCFQHGFPTQRHHQTSGGEVHPRVDATLG